MWTDNAKVASAPDVRLAEVLEEYLEALDAGSAPTRADLFARHPELAEQLASCLASLDFIRRASPAPGQARRAGMSSGTPLPGSTLSAEASPAAARRPGEEGSTADGSSSAPMRKADTAPELVELGAYRIVREIARGGMGIVYEATESASGRRVALKVLPLAAALDPRQLQRFTNEAQAAALLSHPHIVPVYGVGSERDVHYYVMKYIEGRSLAQVIAGLAACPAATLVAQLGMQAAQALELAHQHGIVHRDIKPGNLLVEGDEHLWITDFGLALFQNETGNLTRTGDVIGTLRYMSPEQALARHGIVDQRADVYALGVTLYELATLKPALPGNERLELLRQIADLEPIPPRRLNPALPAALETILLKAMAKEPAARYATAQELALDLERFLASRPIVARRPGPWARARRWLRRHQTLAAAALAGVLLALVGLAVSSVLVRRERDLAERRAEQALHAVDEMYTQVAQRWWFQQPYLEEVQREFLGKALAHYEEFAREHDQAPRWRVESARAARRVADIEHKLGAHAKAQAAYDRAIDRLTRLLADQPQNTDSRAELAHAHNNHGNLLRDGGRLAESEMAYRQAEALFAALLAEDPRAASYREGQAGALGNLGLALHALGRPVDAEKTYRRALTAFESLYSDQPRVPAYGHGLAGCRTNLANLLRDTGRPRAAQVAYEEALATWRGFAERWPGMPIFRQAQAAASSGLGIVYAALGRTQAAETTHRQALDLRARLAADYPGVPAYRQALAASHHSLGQLFAGAGRLHESQAAYEQALSLRMKLADMPGVPGYRQELADSHAGLAELLAAAGKPRQAERALREALRLRQALAHELHAQPESRWDLARSTRALGKVLSAGSLDEARKYCGAAVLQSEKLVAEFPRVPSFRLELAAGRSDLAAVLERTGDLVEAERLHREALAVRAELAAEFHDAPYYRLEVAAGDLGLGELFHQSGRAAEAEAAFRKASASAAKLAGEFPALPDYRRVLARARQGLGELLMATRKLEEAEEVLRQARPLIDKLAQELPQVPAFRHELARHHRATGTLAGHLERAADAQQAFQQELVLREKLAADCHEDIGLVLELAYLLANSPDAKARQPARAVALAAMARAARPGNSWDRTVLGLAHYRAGAFKDAIQVLDAAEGASATACFVLALAHWQLGNAREAVGFYGQGNARMQKHQPLDEELRRLHAETKATLRK